jgi:hypothetical protein
MVKLFLEEYPQTFSRIRQAAVEGNCPELRRGAHNLKGQIGAFTAGPAWEAAGRLEMIGRDGNVDLAEEACTVVEREMERLLPVLGALLAKYSLSDKGGRVEASPRANA